MARAYKTHIELAKEIGRTPDYVARRVHGGTYGDYFHSGGVYYFPTVKGDTRFVEQMIAARYNLL
jgi:hypothetical protein